MASTEIEKRSADPMVPDPERVIEVEVPSEPAPPARSERALAIVTQGMALLSGVMRLALQVLNARQPSARRTDSPSRSTSATIANSIQRTTSLFPRLGGGLRSRRRARQGGRRRHRGGRR
jgi:hypothetical protein